MQRIYADYPLLRAYNTRRQQFLTMFYRKLLRPLMFRLPPEMAHELALHAPAWAAKTLAGPETDGLAVQRWGLCFKNPIGLAAGFDKNGVAVKMLSQLGFGFIEAGTVTNLPQPGNDKPRLFRLPQDRALLNRLGFNNHGAAALAECLTHGPRPDCVLGVNIGKSRAVAVEEAIPDYLAGFEKVHGVADYVAVNVSSPNTPNLRELQQPEALLALLRALQAANQAGMANAKGQMAKPLLVKIAPDMDDDQLAAIVEVAQNARVDGIIATNTTISRAGLQTPRAADLGAGGLSGAPVFAASTRILARLYQLTRGRLPLVGVGGIFSAADAWDKICAGASLVQVYTGFIYQGPRFVSELQAGLAQRLTQHGFKTLDEAVGCRADEYAKVEG